MTPSVADELEAIRALKARYFRLLDAKAWDSWREVFADDVVGVFDNAVSTNGADGQPGPTWEGALTSPTTATGIWAMADIVVFPNGHTLHGAGHYHETYVKA